MNTTTQRFLAYWLRLLLTMIGVNLLINLIFGYPEPWASLFQKWVADFSKPRSILIMLVVSVLFSYWGLKKTKS